ncbi:hypothetical protein AB0C69_37220, partial [Actinomadura sp. NPDC048032]|uniref:hypothetical protein n=1 Tax=Actinomadura sp. NPDC048032 TaxID=3155747 RepID=UPI0034028B39
RTAVELSWRLLRAIAGIAPARLAAHCAIRFSLRSHLPSDAIATIEVVVGLRRRLRLSRGCSEAQGGAD